jgi:hypothetical protein
MPRTSKECASTSPLHRLIRHVAGISVHQERFAKRPQGVTVAELSRSCGELPRPHLIVSLSAEKSQGVKRAQATLVERSR